MIRLTLASLLLAGSTVVAQDDVAAMQRKFEQDLARQQAKFTNELNANREWMQQMTREFEAQNELIRKLRDELVATKRELAVLKSEAGGVDNAELAALERKLSARIEAETAARISGDKQLASGIADEIARAAKAAAKSRPEPRPRPTPTANTIQYTVEPGDTLSAIATAFETSVSRIKSLNGLNSDVIRVGQKLKVPVPAN